jgi:hypothetical protein
MSINCHRIECQTSAGCAHRGPRGEFCWFGCCRHVPFIPFVPGCICPPQAEQTCRNPLCPRGGQMPRNTTAKTQGGALPDWDDLRGCAPDATGALSSEAFVRELREEWR